MKEKRETCKYCGQEMEAKTTRKEFCSVKCKVYWNRQKALKTQLPTPPEVKEAPTIYEKMEARNGLPNTLGELKALCPPELKGFERSAWISTKRQEYII